MRPTLFDLFGEPVSSYFTLLVLGFALGTYLAARRAERLGLDREVMIDIGLYSLIWGVIGGRILHVFADGQLANYVYACLDPSKVSWDITRAECTAVQGNWDAVASVCRARERDCLAPFAFWQGGLAYYGGLVLALVMGVRHLRKERFPVGKGLDLVACAIALGLFFGRMGCFFGGCCFGSPTQGAWGVVFPHGGAAAAAQWRAGLLADPNHVPLPVHPTQLYEAFGCLVLAGALYFRVEPRKRYDGFVMIAFIAAYAVLRFGLEYLRADDRGGFGSLSTSQWISLVAVAASVIAHLRFRAREA